VKLEFIKVAYLLEDKSGITFWELQTEYNEIKMELDEIKYTYFYTPLVVVLFLSILEKKKKAKNLGI
jgi:hypothetical protein